MKCSAVKATLVVWLLSVGSASAFPDRPVRIIVPFAPGGVTDLAARFIGQQLSSRWGQSVIIENRTGGGGMVGVDAGIRAEPDGHTLLMATNGELVVRPAISAKLLFNPDSLMPIAMVASTPYLWAAHKSSGFNTLQDLVAAAKASPGHLTYSSAGYGSTMHMASEQFAAAAGIKMLHVPYRGGAPAATAVVAGEVKVGLVGTNSISTVKDSGTTTLLATTSLARVKAAPDVPTITETGVVGNFEASVWAGLFAPLGTPAAIISKIQADVASAIKDPALIKNFDTMGMDPINSIGAAMAQRIKSEVEVMSKIGKTSNITLE